MEGLGSPLAASVKASAGSVEVRAKSDGIDLDRIRTFVALPAERGIVGVDADVTVSAGSAHGRLALEVQHLHLPGIDDASGRLETHVDGRHGWGRATATIDDVGTIDVRSSSIHVGPGRLFDAAPWRRAWGVVQFHARADLAHLMAAGAGRKAAARRSRRDARRGRASGARLGRRRDPRGRAHRGDQGSGSGRAMARRGHRPDPLCDRRWGVRSNGDRAPGQGRGRLDGGARGALGRGALLGPLLGGRPPRRARRDTVRRQAGGALPDPRLAARIAPRPGRRRQDRGHARLAWHHDRSHDRRVVHA